MNKNISIMATAIAALSLISCTQEEELLVSGNSYESFNDSNAILFGTYLGQAPQSRAGAVDANALKTQGFGVFAYYTGSEELTPGENNIYTPNFMCNQLVSGNKGTEESGNDAEGVDFGDWSYSPVKYWPNNPDEKVSFFAYAPYTATVGQSGITSLPGNTTAGDPKLGYTIPAAPGEQLDLLYADKTLNLIKQNVDQKINFDFNHAMTRIGFERVIELDEVDKDNDGKHDNEGSSKHSLDAGTTVTITKVSISSPDFYKSGTLNLSSGKWEGLKKEAQTYTLSAENNDFTSDGMTATSENSKDKTRLNNDDKYLMIFPTDNMPDEIPVEITVEYNVTTEDENLPGGKFQTTSQVITPFDFQFVKGKWYNFVLHIGMSSVKLDVVDKGWDTTLESSDTEIVVNSPKNDVVSLIYDANGGVFANGSSKYIVTAKVGNWELKNGQNDGHIPAEEAQFIVKNFAYDEIMQISGDGIVGSGDYYFNGWTAKPTENEMEGTLDPDNHHYKPGDIIYIKPTENNTYITIYAWWADSYHD